MKAVAAVLMTMVVCGSLVQTVVGAVYTTGDSAGWTTIGNVDYKQWAATKTFKLGDTIGTYTLLILRFISPVDL